jgi:hypothetical protein
MEIMEKLIQQEIGTLSRGQGSLACFFTSLFA